MFDILLSIILSGIFLIGVYFFQSIFYPLIIFFFLLFITFIFYPQNESLVYLLKAKIIAYLKKDFHYLIILSSIIFFFYLHDLIGFNPSLIASFFILWYFLHLDERASFAAALIFLSLCPFLLIFHLEELAEKSAVLAYYFLVIGVVWQMVMITKEREIRSLTEEPKFVSKHLNLKSDWIGQTYIKNIGFILNQIVNSSSFIIFAACFFVTIIVVLVASQLISNMSVSKTTQVVPSLIPTKLPTTVPSPTKATVSPTKFLPTATVVPTAAIRPILSILNGSTISGWAASTSASLKKADWDNILDITIGDAEKKTYKTIILRYTKEYQDTAKKLRSDLLSSKEFNFKQIFYEEKQEATPAGDLILILGK